jgi:hypothetical protein
MTTHNDDPYTTLARADQIALLLETRERELEDLNEACTSEAVRSWKALVDDLTGERDAARRELEEARNALLWVAEELGYHINETLYGRNGRSHPAIIAARKILSTPTGSNHKWLTTYRRRIFCPR